MRVSGDLLLICYLFNTFYIVFQDEKKPRSIRPRLKLYISFIDAKILVIVAYNTVSTNYD